MATVGRVGSIFVLVSLLLAPANSSSPTTATDNPLHWTYNPWDFRTETGITAATTEATDTTMTSPLPACTMGFVKHPGRAYKNPHVTPHTAREECATACASDDNCRAYSYKANGRKPCRHVKDYVMTKSIVNNGKSDLFLKEDRCMGPDCPLGFSAFPGRGYADAVVVGQASDHPRCAADCETDDVCAAYLYNGRHRQPCRHVRGRVVMANAVNSNNFDLFVKTPKCLGCKADVLFLVDSSNGVKSGKKFARIRQFIQDLVRQYPVQSLGGDVRLSVIAFGATAQVAFELDRYTSADDVIAAVQALRPIGGGRNIPAALKMALSGGAADRYNAPNHVVLITAGTTGRKYRRKLQNQLNKLKDIGTTITVVGITTPASNGEMRKLAAPTDMYFRVASFSQLPQALDRVVMAGGIPCMDN